MFSRRTFLKYTGGTALTLFAFSKLGLRQAIAQIPGGTLDPMSVPKYAAPMLIPPVMPRAGTITLTGGKNADYYEISMKQFAQQILPSGLPATTVWGYGAVTSESKRGLLVHNAPSLTIEAKWNRPVRVKWINDLQDANGNFLPHLLPVDPTLHWANPPGGTSGPRHAADVRRRRPDRTPARCRSSPTCMAPSASPTTATATPRPGTCRGGNIPADYATVGTWFDFFAAKAANSYGVSWEPGYAVFQYPNKNRASTIWYHDHTLGMTRLNVYAGPAGFYLVRGGPAGDDAVLDSRTGSAAVLPGPAPKENDKFPPNKTYYEIPIAIQDRSFNADGSLFYPDTRAFFDGITGPYVPHTDLSPIWNPEFFGNMIMVNGNTWPFQTVEQRRYRFRFLNGCNSRFLILDFSVIPGVEVWQIGNEGGFLAAPVNVTAAGNRLLMGPAERADVIVDFTNVPVGQSRARQRGAGRAVRWRRPWSRLRRSPTRRPPARSCSSGSCRPWLPTRRRHRSSWCCRRSRRCRRQRSPGVWHSSRRCRSSSTTRRPRPSSASCSGDPNTGVGTWTELEWRLPVTENPAVGATEVWELYNATADAHPIHIHEVVFEVVNRQDIWSIEDAASGPGQSRVTRRHRPSPGRPASRTPSSPIRAK